MRIIQREPTEWRACCLACKALLAYTKDDVSVVYDSAACCSKAWISCCACNCILNVPLSKAAPAEWEVECFNCAAIIGYTQEDIIEQNYPKITCPSCNKVIYLARAVINRVEARNRPPTLPSSIEAAHRTKNWDV